MPVFFGSLLMAAVLLLYVLVWRGGVADGERVGISLTGSCAQHDEAMVTRRVAAIGLGEPEIISTPNTIQIVATLPGQDPQTERDEIPELLGRAGRIQIKADDRVLATETDIDEAVLGLDESGIAMAKLVLDRNVAAMLSEHMEDSPLGVIRIYMDGEIIAERPNSMSFSDNEIRVIGLDSNPAKRMRDAASQIIIVNHGPLSCDLEVASVMGTQ